MWREVMACGFGFVMGIAFFGLWLAVQEHEAQEQSALAAEGLWP